MTTGGVVAKESKENNNINNVVTPARSSLPRNKLTSIIKSSQEKTSQNIVAKRSSVGFNQQINALAKSTAKKDLNSSNKIED